MSEAISSAISLFFLNQTTLIYFRTTFSCCFIFPSLAVPDTPETLHLLDIHLLQTLIYTVHTLYYSINRVIYRRQPWSLSSASLKSFTLTTSLLEYRNTPSNLVFTPHFTPDKNST